VRYVACDWCTMEDRKDEERWGGYEKGKDSREYDGLVVSVRIAYGEPAE
jgi:hypothetical protein